MIEVRNLSKYYGHTVGVRDLTFSVARGEVLGFLGPNGAGKTTTMKMLTCFMPPSSGTAVVCGHDIIDEQMEVRKRIGYLPEKTPLYHDMRVSEYLEFVANLKGVTRCSISGSIDSSLERCGLGEVRARTIGTLSKGYQQRVGIAQAILNDPELLILDEPTLGLDPRQMIEIRGLIRNLGGERTVLLSSHILPEVNQVCNRIIVINRGELVAVDTPQNLRERLRKSALVSVKIRDAGQEGRAAGLLLGIEGIIRVDEGEVAGGVRTLRIESALDRDVREEIARTLVSAGIPLLELHSEELTLEDIFVQLVTEEN